MANKFFSNNNQAQSYQSQHKDINNANNKSSAENIAIAERNHSAIEQMYQNYVISPINKYIENETDKIIKKLGCEDENVNLMHKVKGISSDTALCAQGVTQINDALGEDKIEDTFALVIDKIQYNTNESLGTVIDNIKENADNSFSTVIGKIDDTSAESQKSISELREKADAVSRNTDRITEALSKGKISDTFADIVGNIKENADNSFSTVIGKIDDTSTESQKSISELREKTDAVCRNTDRITEALSKEKIGDTFADVVGNIHSSISNVADDNQNYIAEKIESSTSNIVNCVERSKDETIGKLIELDKNDVLNKVESDTAAVYSEVKTINKEIKDIHNGLNDAESKQEKLKKLVIALLVSNVITIAEVTVLIVLFFFS